MMKWLLSFMLCIAIAVSVSCNDSEEQETEESLNESQLQQLKKEITKYPDSLLLIEKLIQQYREAGAYDSALSVTKMAINKAPHIHGLWSIKATLEYENGDTLNAVKSFEQAITIYPLPDYLIALGTIYAQVKNSKALDIANALTSSNSSNIKTAKHAYFIKGLYYNYSGNKKKAIALFDSCIREDYTYMFAYREKAIALYDQQKYEEALKVLDKAVTVQNNFEEGYYWMGNCYKKLDKKEEATENYRRALMYDKDFIEARDSLKTLQ